MRRLLLWLAGIVVVVAVALTVPAYGAVQSETGTNVFDVVGGGNRWVRWCAGVTDADAQDIATILGCGIPEADTLTRVFNNTTWDRLRSVTSGDTASPTGIIGSGLLLHNGVVDSWSRARTVQIGDAAAQTGILATGGMSFNGATFDRTRNVGGLGDGITGTGMLGAGQYVHNGTTWTRQRVVENLGDANAGGGIAAAGLTLFNGTTHDRMRSVAVGDDFAGTGLTASGKFEFDGTNWDRTRHSFSQSTAGVVANGAGTTVSMTATPMSKYTLIVIRTAGATDAVDVRVQCSVDGGTNFADAGITVTSVAGGTGRASGGDVPCNAYRFNVVTVGAGNTLTIQTLAVR